MGTDILEQRVAMGQRVMVSN